MRYLKTKSLNTEIPRDTSNALNKQKKKKVPLYLTPNVIAEMDMTTSDSSPSMWDVC